MKHLVLLPALCLILSRSHAQNVAINTDGSTAHSSSILDVKSTSKGILLPRMSSQERMAIQNPEKGLLVYDNDKNTFMFFDGGQWRPLLGGNNTESVLQEAAPAGTDETFQFGYEISGSGNYLAVSCFERVNGNLDYSGAVYILQRSANGSWLHQAKITGPSPAFFDYFGFSTDMDGDYLIVGAPRKKNANGISVGYAYIYKRTGNAWNLETTLAKSNGQEYDSFGHDVAITTTGPGGVYAAVGAPNHDIVGAANSGYVGLYRKDPAGWVIVHNILSADFKAGDAAGFSVDLEGDLLVAGAPFKEAGSTSDAGGVGFYRYTSTSWQQEWFRTGFESNAALGYSVSISGNKVAAGAPSLLSGGRQSKFVLSK